MFVCVEVRDTRVISIVSNAKSNTIVHWNVYGSSLNG